MATYYAINTGGDVTPLNWSSAPTWAASSNQATGGAGVPAIGDTVYLNQYSTNVAVDTSGCLAGILIMTGYVKTLTVASGKELQVRSNCTFAGTFTGTGNLTLGDTGTGGNQAGSIDGGNVTFSGSVRLCGTGIKTLMRNWVISGVLSNYGGVSTTLAGSVTLTCAGLNLSVGGAYGISAPSTTIILSGGTWQAFGNSAAKITAPLTLAGAVTISGTVYYGGGTLAHASGSITTTGSTLQIVGNATINTSGMTGANAWNNVTVPAAYVVTNSSQWNINGLLTLTASGSSPTLNGSDIVVAGGITISSSTYSTGTAVVKVTGGTLQTGAGGYVGFPLTINPSASMVTISGTFNFGYKPLTYVASTYGVTTTSSTLYLCATATLNVDGITWNNVTNNGATATYTLSSSLTVNGLFTNSQAGTFNGSTVVCNAGITNSNTCSGTTNFQLTAGTWQGAGQFNCNLELVGAGNITIGSSVNHGTGELKYTSGTIITTSSTLSKNGGTLNTNTVQWNNLNPSGTITLTSDCDVNGALTVTNATINGAGYKLKASGTTSSITSLAGTATMVLDGTSSFSPTTMGMNLQINTAGTITLTTLNASGSITVTHTSGTVTGNKDINVAAGATLTLNAPNVTWGTIKFPSVNPA